MRLRRSGWLVLGCAAALVPAACGGTEFSGSGDGGSAAAVAAGATTNGGVNASGASNHAGKGGKPGVAGGVGMGGDSTSEAGTAAGGAGDVGCSPQPARCQGPSTVETCVEGVWQAEECAALESDCAPPTCENGACVSASIAVADVAGDCQELTCAFGKVLQQPALDDVPEARGACDVPYCSKEGEPVFGSAPDKCAVNQACAEGKCLCSGCPNGLVPALSATQCRLPATVATSANKTLAGSAVARVADGNAITTWNSGAFDGTLTLSFAAPQPLMAVIVYVTGSSSGGPSTKLIDVAATLETGSGPAVQVNKQYDYSQAATGPVRFDFGLVKATKLTFKLQSESSWISVNEVLFVVCE